MIARMLDRLLGRDQGLQIDVPGIGAVDIALHDVPDIWISDPIRRGDAYDPDTQALLQDMILPGDTMLDIGANIGWFTVVGSRLVGPRGRVVAIEPDPRNARLLRRNVARNRCRNVTVHEVAAGAESCTARLYRSDDNQGDHRLEVTSDRTEWVDVPVRPIDVLLARRPGSADVIKIDTQGSEVAVLQGMQATLDRNPTARIVLEFWPFGLERCGTSVEALLDLLTRRPVVMWLQRADGSMQRTGPEALLALSRSEFAPHTERHGDVAVIAVHDTATLGRIEARIAAR